MHPTKDTETKYKVINGTSYYVETPDKLCHILENIMQDRIRVTFDFGDTETGISSEEVCDITGYIGKSTGGTNGIPLLVKKSNSTGGCALSTDWILSIRYANKKQGGYLYQLKK